MVRPCKEWAAALSGLALTMALAFPASATEIRGAGASFPANLYFSWIDAFEDVQPDIDVRYESVGSGEGIRRFLEGESDFGASDRALTEEQVASVPDGVIEVPGTAGMVVVAYNLPGIEGQLRLSRTALAGIFTGEIR